MNSLGGGGGRPLHENIQDVSTVYNFAIKLAFKYALQTPKITSIESDCKNGFNHKYPSIQKTFVNFLCTILRWLHTVFKKLSYSSFIAVWITNVSLLWQHLRIKLTQKRGVLLHK